MKDKFSRKKIIITAVVIIAIIASIAWGYYLSRNIPPEPPDTITLLEGRQTHFENLDVGLNSVDDDSAWLSIRKEGEEGSITKQVTAGEIIDIHGYKIEIGSVNEVSNSSSMPGSSQSNVKFTIKKQ